MHATKSARPELSISTVRAIIRGLDPAICEIVDLEVADDDCEDNDGEPVFMWTAEVEMDNGETYSVSVPDHWPDGAEIHY